MTPEYLAQPLTPFSLPTTDGWTLRTIGDTGAYILALPKRRKRLAHWEQVRRLIVKQAGVATVTQHVHHALSKDDKLDVFAFERTSPVLGGGGAHKAGGGIGMKFVLMAFGAAAGIITGSTLALAETSVAPAEEEKIKATIESFGCTGGKIEKADYGYEVDDVKCKNEHRVRDQTRS